MRFRPALPVFCVLLACALGAAESDGKAAKIVTLGDSITKGVRRGVKREETFASLLQAGLRKAGIAADVVNVGIGGERTDQALKRLEKVIALKPDVVTIMYGTNDSYVDQGKDKSRISAEQYRENLKSLIARLRKAGIKPLLMTEPRWGKQASKNGAGEHPNLRLKKYVIVCREVARETKTPLVDHFAHWTKKESRGANLSSWTTDECHPDPQGHKILAELILPKLKKTLRP